MSPEKETALGLHELRVMFLAVSNSWNVNGKPNFRTVRQMLRNTEPADI